MVYPNFKDKHLHEALFNPKDYMRYKKFSKKGLPQSYILTYSRRAKDYFMRKFNNKKLKLHSNKLNIYTYKNVGLVYVTGIGSPMQ